MALARNRPAMILAVLLAGSLALLAMRLGLFEPSPPGGVVEEPCPQVDQSQLGQVIATITGRASRQRMRDWGSLCAYGPGNAERLARGPVETVMIGDSITAQWQAADPELFAGTIVNRGIGGQTSPQVLLRFYPDAIALRPRVIHLIIGINDLYGLRGPTTAEAVRNNIRAMADIAQANRTALVLGSINPVRTSKDQPRPDSAGQIVQFNRWLRGLAAERNIVFADYHAVLSEPSGELKAAFTEDGVHLNEAGYAAMRPVLDAALEKATAAIDNQGGQTDSTGQMR